MAACWKVNWNVDPLAFRVPERAALDEDEPLVDPPPPEDEQAATNEAIATVAIPTVAARWMRRRCMFKNPILRYSPVDCSGARSTGPPTASQASPIRRDNPASLTCRPYPRVKEIRPEGE
jgi:hypothetical protein